jgi:uncharacterized protein YfaS (alpha-2-macroglobulin family)
VETNLQKEVNRVLLTFPEYWNGETMRMLV